MQILILSFDTYTTICLSIYLLRGPELFLFFGIVSSAAITICEQACVRFPVFKFFLIYNLVVEFMRHMINMCSSYWRITKLFSIMAAHAGNTWAFQLFHKWVAVFLFFYYCSSYFYYCHLVTMKSYHFTILICITILANDIKYPFTCLILCMSLEKSNSLSL